MPAWAQADKIPLLMATKIKLEELLEVGAHFGHQTKRWNPKMEEYLYGSEKGVHIFDLIKTKAALEAALEFITRSVSEGKTILLLGTKKQIKDKVAKVGEEIGMPVITERWLGGTISNFDQIRKSTKKLADMKAKMAEGGYNEFTKKERLLIEREITRLDRFFGGLGPLEKVPEMLFVVDIKKEASAVREASRKKITIIGIVDSNTDPDAIDYPIPMNDDASKALEYVLDLVKDAVLNGKTKHKPVKKT